MGAAGSGPTTGPPLSRVRPVHPVDSRPREGEVRTRPTDPGPEPLLRGRYTPDLLRPVRPGKMELEPEKFLPETYLVLPQLGAVDDLPVVPLRLLLPEHLRPDGVVPVHFRDETAYDR